LGQVIVRTRRAVGDDGQSQHTVLTVPRYGFRWVAEVLVERGAGEGQDGSAGHEPPADGDGPAGPTVQPMRPPPSRGPQLGPAPRAQPQTDTQQAQAQPAPGHPVAPGRHPRVAAAAGLLLALVAVLAALWGWRGTATGDGSAPATAAADAEAAPEAPGALLV